MEKLSPKDRALIVDFWESEYQPLIKKVCRILKQNLTKKYSVVSPEELKLLQGQDYALTQLPDFLQKIYSGEIKKD